MKIDRLILLVFLFTINLFHISAQSAKPTPQQLEDKFFEITRFAELENVIKKNKIDVDVVMNYKGKDFPLHVITNGMNIFRGEVNLFGFKFDFVRQDDIFWMKILGFWKKQRIPNEDNNPILNFAEWKNKKLNSHLAGDTLINNVPNWVVQYNSYNENHRLYVAKNSGLVTQVRSKYTDKKTGEVSDYLLRFDNYRMFQNVYAPHKMIVTDFKKGRDFSMEIKKALIRNNIPDTYFKTR